MARQALQERTVRVLAAAQVLNGVGVAGTVAAGSLLVSSITDSETLAGLAQTSSVLGAAALALPLARLTSRGGRRLALSVGYLAGVLGSILAIVGGSTKTLLLMLSGTFLVGAASAAGYQARFAAIDLATNENRARQLSFVVWGLTIGAVAGQKLDGTIWKSCSKSWITSIGGTVFDRGHNSSSGDFCYSDLLAP